MRIVKFLDQKKIGWGIVEGDAIRRLKNHPFSKIELSRKSVGFKKVKLLAPATPSKIILVGLNYKDHARELKMKVPKEPIIFLKPPTAVIGQGGHIIYPTCLRRVDFEAELALVMKKKARNIPENKTRDYILGYTCLNDVTARDLQKKDGQWTRAKSFDTFCPLGPWLETEVDPRDLRITSYLNGKYKQDSSTSNFIFPVPYLVSFISRIMTLLPGDIISTGTPPGVGAMKQEDIIEIEIEKIGRLKNKVVRADESVYNEKRLILF